MARPKSEDPVIFLRVGLRKSGWEHVMLWREGDDSPTRNLEEMVERSQKMFPAGPGVFGRHVRRSRHRAPAAVKAYAEKHGLSRSEALAVIASRYVADHPEEFG